MISWLVAITCFPFLSVRAVKPAFYLWSYRRFALREPHLYAVMLGPGLATFRLGDPADLEAARSTFVSLLRRIHACVNAGRWEVDDVTTAGEAVWSGVHGHTTLEHTGFFGAVGRDPVRSYSEILTRMSIGLGDDPPASARCQLPGDAPYVPIEPRPRLHDERCHDSRRSSTCSHLAENGPTILGICVPSPSS